MRENTAGRFADYHRVFREAGSEMPIPPHVVDALLRDLRGSVLDVGCGDAHKLRGMLDRAGGRVTKAVALEPSPLYRRAERKLKDYPQAEVLHTSLEDWDSEERFDVILLFEVIEHVPPRAREGTMDRLKSRLKKDGLLALSTPNRPIYRLKCRLCGDPPDPTHTREFTFSELREFLGLHFRSISYHGSLPWMGLVRSTRWLQRLNAFLDPVHFSHCFYAMARGPTGGGRL